MLIHIFPFTNPCTHLKYSKRYFENTFAVSIIFYFTFLLFLLSFLHLFILEALFTLLEEPILNINYPAQPHDKAAMIRQRRKESLHIYPSALLFICPSVSHASSSLSLFSSFLLWTRDIKLFLKLIKQRWTPGTCSSPII